jgi:hypothetical protein
MLLLVAAQAIVHDEVSHAPRGRLGLGDVAMAGLALQPCHDHMPAMRVENVPRLLKEPTPLERRAALENLYEALLLRTLSYGLIVTERAGLSRRQSGKRLLLVVNVAFAA